MATSNSAKRQHHGVRKVCGCARLRWAKCRHPWHFNFKLPGGTPYRFSLEDEMDPALPNTREAAEAVADRIRNEIRLGTFMRAADRRAAAAVVPAAPDTVTVEKFGETYLARVSAVRARNKSWKNDQYQWAQVSAFRLEDGSRFGEKALGAVTEDDLEAVLLSLRAKGRAVATRNQYVQLLKAAFRWAVKKGYLARNPISDDSAIKRGKPAQRSRRLDPDVLNPDGTLRAAGEERRLLASAAPRLYNIIVAALETCCRRGELLGLQWRDVSLDRGELTVRAENAKDGDTRVLPISARLSAVLTMAKTDPAGKDYEAGDYVFGELGMQVENIKRAWETCVLKAHGHDPAWQKTALAPASRARLTAINLHFHDLRHEGASRLLEAGWPLHHVQEMLGHASLEQTSTYLNVQRGGLRDSMRKIDALRAQSDQVGDSCCNPVAISTEIEAPIAENQGDRVATKASVN